MKDLKHSTRPATRLQSRSVSVRIREYQVTVKVKSPVPQTPSARVLPLFR